MNAYTGKVALELQYELSLLVGKETYWQVMH